jgi:hypothetical protein
MFYFCQKHKFTIKALLCDTECIVVSPQQWSWEYATVLSFMYIAYLVNLTLMWLFAVEGFSALVHPNLFESHVKSK